MSTWRPRPSEGTATTHIQVIAWRGQCCQILCFSKILQKYRFLFPVCLFLNIRCFFFFFLNSLPFYKPFLFKFYAPNKSSLQIGYNPWASGMCLHPRFEVSTTAKISQGEWGLATSKHLRSNCLPASGSYQILEPQGDFEFIQCILHFTGKGAEVKAQRIGTKAQPKVRFCLPKVTICSQKTRKATKATPWPSTLSHLSRAVPPRALGCNVCAWAPDRWMPGHGALVHSGTHWECFAG